MNPYQYRLTNEEITVAVDGVSSTPSAWRFPCDRAIADAATEKALRYVLTWLQGFETSHRHIHGYYSDFPGISRSHGLRMATEELEAMLAAGGVDVKR
mgnify:CR=1 FL=1